MISAKWAKVKDGEHPVYEFYSGSGGSGSEGGSGSGVGSGGGFEDVS